MGRVLALALTAAAALAAGVEAHVQFSTGEWVFRGRTIAASGDRSEKRDPITIIFKGHDRTYSPDNVFDHISDHTGWSGAGPCAANQRAVWNARNSNNTTSDRDDFQLDNRGAALCYLSRWHLRGWDDQEHDNFTADHGRSNQWAIAAVHHEDNTHDIDMDWDVARRQFIDNMAGHCSWPQWERHLGAHNGGDFIGDYRNSGWIGRISLKHTPDC